MANPNSQHGGRNTPSVSGETPLSSKAEQAFSREPSIMDLFSQAKRILALQPRIDNRHVRQDSTRAQRCMSDPRAAGSESSFVSPKDLAMEPHNKVLDLLSPLSVDDLRGTPSTSVTIAKHNKGRADFMAPEETTPRSMDSSPRTYDSARSASNLQRISEGISPRNPQRMPQESIDGRKPVSQAPSDAQRSSLHQGQPALKSNLTSSLKSAKQDRPSENSANSESEETKKPTECKNCGTLKTPLWRKDPDGNTLCNACGLFLKLHGTMRPLSLKTDVIRKRSSRRSSVAPRGPGSVPSVSGMPTSMPRNGSYVMDFTKGKQDYSAGIPISNSPMSMPPSSGYSYGSMGSNGFSVDNCMKPKNVLILPKPLGPGSYQSVSTPTQEKVMQYSNPGSMPSSPYSTSATSQFKRKKSEISIPDMSESYGRRLNSGVSFSTSFTNGSVLAKRGFQALPQTKKNLMASNGRLLSNAGMAPSSVPSNATSAKYISNPQVGPASVTDNVYFDQIAGASPYPQGSNGFRPSRGSIVSDYTQFSVPSPPLFDDTAKRPSFVVPSSFTNYDGRVKCESDLASPSKNEDDMETDDFFKNYTSLHSEVSDETTSPETALMGEMGDKLEIRPTNLKSSLTHGLKGEHQPNGFGAQPNPSSDLDWLKFDV